MSIAAMEVVWKSKLPPMEKLLALALADSANPKGFSVFPSTRTMMERSSMSRRTVFRKLRALAKPGLISATGKLRTGQVVYRLHLELFTGATLTRSVSLTPGGVTVTPAYKEELSLNGYKPSPAYVPAAHEGATLWGKLFAATWEPERARTLPMMETWELAVFDAIGGYQAIGKAKDIARLRFDFLDQWKAARLEQVRLRNLAKAAQAFLDKHAARAVTPTGGQVI